ncbi:MAG: polysaccharide pyruvyl transferase family protein [Candidatus Bathyarchaeia archaeon]
MDPSLILMTNVYTWLNKGDAAITISMIKALRKQWPKTKIWLLSINPSLDSFRYKKYGSYVAPEFFAETLASKKLKIIKILEILKTIVQVTFIVALCKLGFKLQGSFTLQKYFEADIVISSGGGFLNDNFGSFFLLHLFQIFVATLLKKPTVLCAQSIGPFRNKLGLFLTKIVLKKANLITLREAISESLLRKAKARSKIFVTADMAFALSLKENGDFAKKSNQDYLKLPKNFPLVGITVRKWIYPGCVNPKEKYAEYVETFTQFVNYITDHMNATVIFLPQVIAPREDDRITALEIAEKVKNRKKVKVLLGDYSPYQMMHIIKKMDLFVGTRMHSNIFSLIMLVPTIAISYEHKTDGMMRMLKLNEWVIPINSLSFKNLKEKVDKAWLRRKEIKKDLHRMRNVMMRKAKLNITLIKQVWEEYNLKLRESHSHRNFEDTAKK